MLSRIICAAIKGLEGNRIMVETDISRGLPSTNIIGLPDTTVKEASGRVKSAIISSDFEYPRGKVIVNLSPAWLRKKGSHFDLAIAVGILTSSGQVFDGEIRDTGFLGELSLSGEVKRCKGIMPMVKALRDSGAKRVVVPRDCVQEAALVDNIEILPMGSLSDVIAWLNGQSDYSSVSRPLVTNKDVEESYPLDYITIKGQEPAKRAVMIAAAGGHNIMMIGSPGSGKTMMAERMPYILPPLSREEIIDLTTIYSIGGFLSEDSQIQQKRPFRMPGMSLTVPGLLGSGLNPTPGESTLAHKGILFIDEIGERKRELIDSLRIPLERKEVIINRGGEIYRYPADFILVGATNPCKCGNYGDPRKECTCTPYELQLYRSKFSGPIMGRIDIHIELMSPEYSDLSQTEGLCSKEMNDIVIKTRKIQERRNGRGRLNSNLEAADIDELCPMSDAAKKLMETAYEKMRLDPRTVAKTRKVARTIADIDDREMIEEQHLAEALQYRNKRSLI